MRKLNDRLQKAREQQKKARLELKRRPFQQAASPYIAMGNAAVAITVALASARNTLSEISQAKALGSAVEQYGVSQGLVSFVGGAIEGSDDIFREMPSAESMERIPLAVDDARTKNFLAEIKETLAIESAVTAEESSSVIDGLMAVIKTVGATLDPREDLIEGITAALEDAEVSEEALGALSAQVMSAEALGEYLQILIGLVSDMSVFSDMKEMTSEDVAKHVDVLTAAVTAAGPAVGLSISDEVVTVDADAVDEKFAAEAGTLLDKGYTVETIKGLLGQVSALIDALENVRDNADAIEASFREAFSVDDHGEENEEGAGDSDGDDDDDDDDTDDDAESDSEENAAGEEASEGESGSNDDNADSDAGEAEEPAANEEGAGSDMADPSTICNLVCSYATVCSSVFLASASVIASATELGEVIAGAAGKEVGVLVEQGSDAPKEDAMPAAEEEPAPDDAPADNESEAGSEGSKETGAAAPDASEPASEGAKPAVVEKNKKAAA